MNNFDIVKLDNKENKNLVINENQWFSFWFVNELQQQLRTIDFSGLFVIDELLHSGNNEERFISGFFDGNSFDNSKFKFEYIDKKSNYS